MERAVLEVMLQGRCVDEGWLFTSFWGKKVKNAAPKRRPLLDSSVTKPWKTETVTKTSQIQIKAATGSLVALTQSQQMIHQTLTQPKQRPMTEVEISNSRYQERISSLMHTE